MSSRSNLTRLALIAIGFIGALTGPFWLPLLSIFFLAIRWSAWEAILLGAFVDLMWLPHAAHAIPLYTIAAVLLVWGLEPLRQKFLIG